MRARSGRCDDEGCRRVAAAAPTTGRHYARSMDRHKLGRYPRVDKLPRLPMRPSGPVVMVNLLAFKERATGAYAGRSGREAYQDYARGAALAQRSMGSRLVWSGDLMPGRSN